MWFEVCLMREDTSLHTFGVSQLKIWLGPGLFIHTALQQALTAFRFPHFFALCLTILRGTAHIVPEKSNMELDYLQHSFFDLTGKSYLVRVNCRVFNEGQLRSRN